MRNLNNTWVFRELNDLPSRFQSTVGGFSLVPQTLYRRGIKTIPAARSFLDPAHYQPSPASDLPGLTSAVDRIQGAISSRENILVWGDFDVDGQTSTTLLKSALSDLGANVFHYIPNRATESHGISVDSLSTLLNLHQINLIISCDTGIDAGEAVDYANSSGVDVIITDHHQLPEQLPNALAIVNPALLDPSHPLSSLPGVGVAYKLIEELYARSNLDPTRFLDLAALGIVADVAILTDDTRFMLQMGLKQLRNTPRLGLQLLCKNAKLDPRTISEDQIGFTIAPRLNALGRLSDANSCVDLFTSTDQMQLSTLVNQLETLNLRRQELTEQIFNEAQELIQSDPDIEQDFPVLVLPGPVHWHPGVIGIVASRLVDRYQKPVIMLTVEGEGARGSARSIPGVGISKLISMSSTLLISHGGHPMAAGLSLPQENISLFRRSLADSYAELLGDTPLTQEVIIDAELAFPSITPDFITDFMRLAPFGAGNPKLMFAARDVYLNNDKIIGKNGKHRKLVISDTSGAKKDFLWWNSKGIDLPANPFDIAFSLQISTYRNQEQAQATLHFFRETQSTPVYISKKHKIDLFDHRDSQDPSLVLKGIVQNQPDALVWSEYLDSPDVQVQTRSSLSQANTLILWSSPPSLFVLKSIIDICSPKEIHFFAVDSRIVSQKDFLEALVGLLRHLNSSGKKYAADLFAQRIGLTPALVEIGIDWIHHHGDYDLSTLRSDNQLRKGSGIQSDDFSAIDKKLKLMLLEIRLFRNKYKTASLQSIL